MESPLDATEAATEPAVATEAAEAEEHADEAVEDGSEAGTAAAAPSGAEAAPTAASGGPTAAEPSENETTVAAEGSGQDEATATAAKPEENEPAAAAAESGQSEAAAAESENEGAAASESEQNDGGGTTTDGEGQGDNSEREGNTDSSTQKEYNIPLFSPPANMNKEKLQRILLRRQRAEQHIKEAHSASSTTIRPGENNLEGFDAEATAAAAAARMEEEVQESFNKLDKRHEAEMTVNQSIQYQRALQSRRLATLPSLLARTGTEASKQQEQQQEQQSQDGQEQHEEQHGFKQQQQLQQLESILQSVQLEEQLLQELKRLKLDEQSLFLDDAKRKDQRFADCISDQKEELKATAALMNAEYDALRQQANIELLRLEQVVLAQRKQVLELELHLESLLAAFQLRQEKLTFNVLLLTERTAANAAAYSRQRLKLNQCREALTEIAAKFRENVQASAECRRLWKQHEQLQRAFEEERKIRQGLFKQLWAHQEKEIMELHRGFNACARFNMLCASLHIKLYADDDALYAEADDVLKVEKKNPNKKYSKDFD
ncbi:hypothetical protein, conserved [Eimeria maxima]|uniref:Uncharacterized protein n=1 Tax=Eimeria maxima TaxID=5804 RepID=U6LZQ4_EIMMA|nr:hypothetical protein, conserved [Eimeria maxima]CDJ57447.1 hypothetical protein, conserved [Eimeria maxima]